MENLEALEATIVSSCAILDTLHKSLGNQQMFEQEVFNAHVKSLRNSLMKVVQDECYGCQIGHQSQK